MKHLLPIVSLTLVLLSGCQYIRRATFAHEERNSVYYWKTVFNPDSADFAFLRRHHIGRIYLRMFDVSVNPEGTPEGDLTVPNATVRIPDETYYHMKDSLASMQFVPVVYITLNALKAMKDQEGKLANHIVTRVKHMCSYHELPQVEALQLDCDWTASTESSFFALCDSVNHELHQQQLKWDLSSTIRLHQLSREAPPVDYGVLMVYNTGNFQDPDAANSILDEKDVKPYLKHLGDYPLHLDVAYPTYSWQLLFHRRQFAGLLNGVDVADTTRFEQGENAGTYRCREDIPYQETIIRRGDILRVETSSFPDILRVKTLIDAQLSGNAHSQLLYHFDLSNLSHYSDDEINQLFTVTPVR